MFPNAPIVSEERRALSRKGAITLQQRYPEERKVWFAKWCEESSKALKQKWQNEHDEWASKLKEAANRPTVKKRKVDSFKQWLNTHPEHREKLSNLMKTNIRNKSSPLYIGKSLNESVRLENARKAMKKMWQSDEGFRLMHHILLTNGGYKKRFPCKHGCHLFRSKLEVAVANLLHDLDIAFSYEKIRMRNKNRKMYVNDFYIKPFNLNIEVAGMDWLESYRVKTETKIQILVKHGIRCEVVRDYKDLNRLKSSLILMKEVRELIACST